MKRFLSLGFALLAVVALAACQTTVTKIDDAIAKNLPTACAALDTAHAAFVAVSTTGKIKASIVTKEAAAYAGVAAICADPSSVSTSTALVKVATAYAAVVNALKAADGS
ncbi:hypothetical protein [Pleomorphomonas oryzae]|uniref:hypothetical protein n=1 Tax=Pleomorphomonas oryzae TaxID=261934 RepID=UPI0004122D90|nr:hypothetical protein [Pleomorphomonas oryzae]